MSLVALRHGRRFDTPIGNGSAAPLNRSRIATVVCVPLTSQLKWADAPGNVLLTAAASGLDRDSVANVSLIVAIDKAQLVERVGKVTARKLERVLAGVDVVLGR